MSKSKLVYVPQVNPLAKTEYVKPYIKKDGTIIQAHMSKPKFRHKIYG
jgi:hypothetical protein